MLQCAHLRNRDDGRGLKADGGSVDCSACKSWRPERSGSQGRGDASAGRPSRRARNRERRRDLPTGLRPSLLSPSYVEAATAPSGR